MHCNLSCSISLGFDGLIPICPAQYAKTYCVLYYWYWFCLSLDLFKFGCILFSCNMCFPSSCRNLIVHDACIVPFHFAPHLWEFHWLRLKFRAYRNTYLLFLCFCCETEQGFLTCNIL